MTWIRGSLFNLLVIIALLMFSYPSRAQTTSSGAIVGTVTNSSGDAVSGATVTLFATETNTTFTSITTSQGQYTFPLVAPGIYRIIVQAKDFRKTEISGVRVVVAKGILVNMALNAGDPAQPAIVTSAPSNPLETTGSEVGNVWESADLLKLPTSRFQTVELFPLQPTMAVNLLPHDGGLPGAVRVAGAMEDQNTITLDGIDITDNAMLANDNGLRTTVPLPLGVVEEFRVGVSDENPSYGRSDGARIAVITPRGSKDWHGTAYWDYQNSALDANTWDDNRLGIANPQQTGNLFGGHVGGPVGKGNTYFFVDYEGQRNQQELPFSELVPTNTLRQGILRFEDSSGNIDSYNLSNPQSISSLCGPAGNQSCDPRQLGISPTISQMWSLMPKGNNPALGDGLNTMGFTSNVLAPSNGDFFLARLDHRIDSKWQVSGMFGYDRNQSYTTGIVNTLNAGNPVSESYIPVRSNFVSASLTGQLSPAMINTFRFGYVRDRFGLYGESAAQTAGQLNLTGTNSADGPVAISTTNGIGGTSPLSGALIDEPINVYSGQAGSQFNDNKDIQFVDDITDIRGNHTLQAGVQLHYLLSRQQGDNLTGAPSSLTATLDADVTSNINIPTSDRPPICVGSASTNCLLQGDVESWDRLYATTLGLVDNVSVQTARGSNLSPQSLGTPPSTNTTQWAPYFYAMDTWRFRPSLTFTYGVDYGWQTAPTEQLGRQAVEINAQTGQEITASQYLDARMTAATRGEIYNPEIGYLPVGSAHMPLYKTDLTNVAPRVGVAWHPSFDNWLMKELFGHEKSVFRGGGGIYYDRIDTAQSVTFPMLAGAFNQTLSVQGPLCNASGQTVMNCNASPGAPNPALSSFRVGWDGQIPVPVVPQFSSPVVPNSPSQQLLSFQLDPNFKTARSYQGNFTVQRQLGAGLMLELSVVARAGRDLPESVNLDQAPYFMIDPVSRQSFAQAFDAVSTELRNGQPATPQPWFEDMAPNIVGTRFCPPSATSSTACLATGNAAAFINGLVSGLFNTIDTFRAAQSLPAIVNQQTQIQEMRTYEGRSNYHGYLVTLRKDVGNRLTFQVNYTRSTALDNGVSNQGSVSYYDNSYFPNASYGPSAFDERNIINASSVYHLPLGPGRRWHFGGSLDKVLGGWYMSGIFTYHSGLPLTLTESSQVWGNGLALSPNTAANLLFPATTAVNSGVIGTNNISTNGNPATGGTGLNLFTDPVSTFNSALPIDISSTTTDGRTQPIFGLPFWNLDYSLGKEVTVREQMKAAFAIEFFNVLNHPNFATPSLSLTSPESFGVIASTLTPTDRTISSRSIQFTFRLNF